MGVNSLAVNELMALLERLQQQEKQAEADVLQAQERRAAVQEKLEHVRGTLALLSEEGGGPSGTSLLAAEWEPKLRGLSNPAAVFRIAEESGDVLEPRKASEILIATGHWRGKPQNLNSVIYHIMHDSGRFRRLKQGRYKLIRKQAVGGPTPEDSAA